MGGKNNQQLSTIDYINKANLVHNNKYNYTKTVYVNTYAKIIIICPIHGEFQQSAKDHLKGGCRHCAKELRKQTNLKLYGVENTFQSPEKQQKIKQTNLERYGFEHNSLNPNTIEKRKQTFINNYGVDHPQKSIPVQQKTKQTNLERYGCSNPQQNIDVQQKTKNTNLDRYGVEYTLQYPEIRQQIKQTNVEKYGFDHPWKSPTIQEQIKQTNIERYNSPHPSQSAQVKEKRKQTSLEKFGADGPLQAIINPETIEKFNDTGWLIDQHHNQQKTFTCLAEEYNVSISFVQQHYQRYEIDTKYFFQSTAEKQIIEYIKTIYSGEIIESNRTLIAPHEIDIYLPEIKLAIEFDGIFWHSELNGKDKHYHVQKSQQCETQHIKLIHIFDNEWALTPEIVKSRISSLLHHNAQVYARKCSIVKLSSADATAFYNNTHIQGTCSSQIHYGLIHKDELIAAISLSIPRFNNDIEYELTRFSNKLYTTVIGGASKLLRHFEKIHTPKSLISYSDNRWNTGNLYNTLGFTYSHTSLPNYFYFHKNTPYKLMSRIGFQKHKLEKQLKSFDSTKTEWENMIVNGYDRIWDCGNKVFIKKYSQEVPK
jgi:hypothetical protein